MSASQNETRAGPGIGLMVLALTPFALGYFLSYLYRAMNAIVAPDLERELNLTAGELGLLTAAYLLAFSLFQLPLGILLDRFGPRRVQAGLVAVGAFGAALFAFGSGTASLTLARAIIGLGFAGGLMSSFKAVVLWVPEPRRALANSCVMSIGAIGLALSTAPTEWAVQAYGWRNVFLGLALFTLLISAAILLIVPERGSVQRPAPLAEQIADVGRIYRSRIFLALAPMLAITAGNHIALQTLWAGAWLRDIAGLGRTAVAEHLFIMAVAFFIGVLISGAIADWLGRHGISLLDSMLGFILLFIVSQGVLMFEPRASAIVWWCMFCMTGHVAVLAYPWLSSQFGVRLSGRTNTAMNLLMFMAAFAIQYAVGMIIDRFPRTASGGYDPAAYRTVFAILIAIQLAALAWYLAHRRMLLDAEAARTSPALTGPYT